ncbi:hypothetical protein D3C81_1582150 [compost metagenome]
MGTAVAVACRHGATRHGEEGLQGWLGAVVAAKVLGDNAEGQRMGEHLVVPGEVAHGEQVDAGVLLHLPVGCAQLAAYSTQPGFVEFTLAERFLGFFQFAIAANVWKAQVVCQRHVLSLRIHK